MNNSTVYMPTIYIIGAGISGLSTGLLFAENGYNVKIFEATKAAGGRVRSFYDDKLATELDNGNHLILGANTKILKLIKNIGSLEKFHKISGGKFNFYNSETGERFLTEGFKIGKIPNVEAKDYLSFFKLIFAGKKTVSQVFGEQSGLFKNFIENISNSILNTNPHVASARVFRNVLFKILASKILTSQNGLDYYFPKTNWNDALITPLLERLKNLGVEVEYNKSVKRIICEKIEQTAPNKKSATQLIFSDSAEVLNLNNIVILATPATVTESLLEDVTTPKKHNTILNIHFKFEHKISAQIFAVLNSYIEWVFVKPNLISTTTSAASEELLNLPEEELVTKAWADICSYLQIKDNQIKDEKIKNKKIPPYRIIREKRATYSADEQTLKQLPTTKTPYKNVFLVGDYVRPNFYSAIIPATLEAAVQSAESVFRKVH
jgi:uncharacterized protein with NAD-binding domain and iron-sulfur cluster